jgi:hypothetical protein
VSESDGGSVIFMLLCPSERAKMHPSLVTFPAKDSLTKLNIQSVIMKIIVKTLLLLTVTIPVYAATNVTADMGWLKLKYKQLAAIKEIDKINQVRFPTSDDKGSYSYYPSGNGRIVFKDNSWVLLVSHSIHAEDALGDLTLVRTSDGKYFVNKGHVCNTLLLETKEKITSLKTFLDAKGRGAKSEPVPWEEYKDEQPPPGEAKPNTVSTPPEIPKK